MLAGFGLGAVAVQGLHAQAKPPVYQVVEIDMSDQEAYLPLRNKLAKFRSFVVEGVPQ
jgi:hypothetical protein